MPFQIYIRKELNTGTFLPGLYKESFWQKWKCLKGLKMHWSAVLVQYPVTGNSSAPTRNKQNTVYGETHGHFCFISPIQSIAKSSKCKNEPDLSLSNMKTHSSLYLT